MQAPTLMSDISRMSVTRDKLYEEVWAEPMAKVAVRYRISADYLARVCHHLNVPFPHRGDWAKRQFGKAPTRLPLPAPRPGEVIEWERGDAVPRTTPAVAFPADSGTSGRPASRSERPARHQLLAGIRESFDKVRLSEVGYLRPFKRNLVDIFVTKEALAHALDTASDLFLRFEAHGNRVLGTGESNGAPGRTRTCGPRLRRPVVRNGYSKAVIAARLIDARQVDSWPEVGNRSANRRRAR